MQSCNQCCNVSSIPDFSSSLFEAVLSELFASLPAPSFPPPDSTMSGAGASGTAGVTTSVAGGTGSIAGAAASVA